MICSMIARIIILVLDCLVLRCGSEQAKDLEIRSLHHQLRTLQRTSGRPARLSRGDKMMLAILATTLKAAKTGAKQNSTEPQHTPTTPSLSLLCVAPRLVFGPRPLG